MKAPRSAEIATVDCFCDHCGQSLDRLKVIWVWNEHFGCSRDHVQLAQGKTNREWLARQSESNPPNVLAPNPQSSPLSAGNP